MGWYSDFIVSETLVVSSTLMINVGKGKDTVFAHSDASCPIRFQTFSLKQEMD